MEQTLATNGEPCTGSLLKEMLMEWSMASRGTKDTANLQETLRRVEKPEITNNRIQYKAKGNIYDLFCQ